MKKYNPSKIEKKWQKYWEAKKIYRAHDESEKLKFYQLETFPYPSAAGLHVGHPKGYIAEDIHARYMRMKGSEVMYTMGWDAFGLPTENYAIKVGKSPQQVAEANVKNFRRQVKMFGLSYDWDREIDTSSPEYYKWTQWLFIQLYKAGLAYQKLAKVNWCPKDQTVLANEQVVDGKCERCGEATVQKEMKQWFFKITDYSERLLNDLEGLDWPEATIKRQQDWIGKSEGAKIKFLLANIPGQLDGKHFVEVFTTRPDTLFGATFVVISPEVAQRWIDSGWQAGKPVEKYISDSLSKKELERLAEAGDKTGIDAGIKAVNPANKEEIPVWIADYVLGSYGTGAIMAVPAHDQRDYEFAKKFNLPIKIVIEPETGRILPNEQARKSIVAIVENPISGKFLTLNWGPKLGGTLFIGGGREEGEDEAATAIREIKEETGYVDLTFVAKTELMHHHYFAFSKNVARNIEVVGLHFCLNGDKMAQKDLQHDEKDNFEIEWLTKEEILRRMEDENHLLSFRRLLLGEIYDGNGLLTSSGKFDGMNSEKAKWEITKFVEGERQTQYKLRDWSVSRQRYWGAPIPIIYCEKCALQDPSGQGIVPVPEEDLPVKLPNLKNYRPKGVPPLAGSKKFIEIKCPNCKNPARRDPETLDTFVDSSWYYLRYPDPKNSEKPFDKNKIDFWMPVDLYVIGAEHAVLHLLYSRFITKFLHDKGYVDFTEPFVKLRHLGLIQGSDGHKMSKSRGNVVNPDDLVGQYGADAIRMYEMFMGPFEDGQPWDTRGVIGVYRFLNRMWNLFQAKNAKTKIQNGASGLANDFEKDARGLESFLNKAVKKIGEDIENLRFNTAVSELMKLLNEFEINSAKFQIPDSVFHILAKIVAPFAPHLAEELWADVLGQKESIHFEKWPEYNPELIKEATIKLIVQVNGKMRDVIEAPFGLDEAVARQAALASENVQKHVAGSVIKKVIYVSNRLINFII
ncbi:MAG: class I tRNA ligase family protein [Candidatus Yanofskybacteria bacterium]|nr:class I tRNA ligase family protein [Candidatus Yanofskybacteria bacterium]